MKKILFILSVLLLSSCNASYVEGDEIGVVRNIKYFKDKRTGLCFAKSQKYQGFSITCVPCNTEVERLIMNQ